MVTGKTPERAALAAASVSSFLAQTHRNRALVIINDAEFELDVGDVPAARVTCIRLKRGLSIGQLRNCGLDAIPDGAIWTYWDDDDWHHPRVMAAQYRVLSTLGVQACFLQSQVKYGFAQNVAFIDRHPGGFAGTLRMYKQSCLRFEDVPTAEDSLYTAALKRTFRWYPWSNPPHYYLRFFHGGNSWGEAHFGLVGREPGRWRLPHRSADYLRSVLPFYAARRHYQILP